MNKKIVVALGGNAILQKNQKADFETQYQNIVRTASLLANIIKEGHQLFIVHGNGPQVGNLLLQNEEAQSTPPMPLDILNAQSQGLIGTMIVRALKNQMPDHSFVNVVTHVKVSKTDPAFGNFTKPIGSFYSIEEAKLLEEEKNWTLKEDANRGYRRVVASPKPLEIIECQAIEDLSERGNIVIAAGGGGIPVIVENNQMIGIECVIDKDLSSCLLAESVKADCFMILTDVENVYIRYGKPNETALKDISVKELEQYYKDGEFAKGSMEPKIEACIRYVQQKKGNQAIICSLHDAYRALKGECGTIIQ